jgi:20S proteasome subunit beta 1
MSMFSVEHGQPSVHTAGHLFQEMIYQNKDRLSAGIIVAGWDKKNGGSVWNVPLGGGLFQQPWAIGGSGSAYIYGYCDSTWKEGWGRDETLEFVENGELSAIAVGRTTLTRPMLSLFHSTEPSYEQRRIIRWHNPNGRHF